jgi:transcription elongation factor Elf1
MGRRRRRVIRIVKKKLPTVFICPRCGEEAVRVTIAKDTGHATVLCALCNLKDDFPAHPAAQAIDVYSYFTDRFYGVKEPRAIIPRERAFAQAPEEQAVEDETAVPEPPLREGEESSSTPGITAVGIVEEDESSGPVTPEKLEAAGEKNSEEKTTPVEESPVESPEVLVTEMEKETEEEAEPFADILESKDKDKKRYSSQPLPQQSTEQTS